MDKYFRLKQIVNNKYFELTVLAIMAVIPISGILSDWIFTVVKDESGLITADVSFFIEYEFFSIWNATLISVYGIVRLINHFRKEENKNKWAESDTTLTIITAYTLIVCLMYTQTFIFNRDQIAGFKEWFQIIKSSLEHWIVPLMILFYYLTRKRKNPIGNVAFMKTKWFKATIFPMLYELFILIRYLLLKNYAKGLEPLIDKLKEQHVPFLFPYSSIDPGKTGTIGFVFVIIAFLVTCFLISCAMNKLSEISYNAIYVNDGIKKEEAKSIGLKKVKRDRNKKVKEDKVEKSN